MSPCSIKMHTKMSYIGMDAIALTSTTRGVQQAQGAHTASSAA